MKRIAVDWQMPCPPVQATSWYSWKGVPLKNDKKDLLLEQSLGLSLGSIAMLRQAFETKLGRYVGWDLPQDLQQSGMSAGAIFKRGVQWRSGRRVQTTEVKEGGYCIDFRTATRELAAVPQDNKYFYIIDQNVLSKWPALQSLPNHVVIDVSELRKNLDSVALILDASKKFPETDGWVAIGGGILTDIAGFAAALASAAIIFVPTTLLAMADASVGGKTGVNFPPHGKNQLGSFYFPTQVIIWEGWLRTLPRRELLAGASECYKHAFLSGDRDLAEKISAALKNRTEDFAAILPRIVQVKADVVKEDPTEAGKRAILNFGHTLGHAIEAVSQEDSSKEYLLHGEALGFGLLFAALVSQEYANLPANDFDFMASHLKNSGCLLPFTLLSRFEWPRLCAFMEKDKKSTTISSRWVLLEKLGKPYERTGKFTMALSLEKLAETWRRFLQLQLKD